MFSKALANLAVVLSQGLANFAFRRPQVKPLNKLVKTSELSNETLYLQILRSLSQLAQGGGRRRLVIVKHLFDN